MANYNVQKTQWVRTRTEMVCAMTRMLHDCEEWNILFAGCVEEAVANFRDELEEESKARKLESES